MPPGVTQKDIDLFKETRERALLNNTQPLIPQNMLVGTPLGTAQLGALSPPSAAIIAQQRCPAAIEFGQYEIETWYSSPFPQEYARLV